MKLIIYFIGIILLLSSCSSEQKPLDKQVQVSGIYPHLAFYNNEGECGTGALVPWKNRLWAITYGPHMPYGSSDKLYEITENLELIVREESIGGTPANRLVHQESDQLFIGPYVIDGNRNVKVVPIDSMFGRLTGTARHLTDPEEMVYHATMEQGFYEVDVNSLHVKTLFKDPHYINQEGKIVNAKGTMLPGAHGKGLYSGQGVLVFSNNGERSKEALHQFDIESGVLAEWDGTDWKVIRRNQFVEITGPGGIHGNNNPETDPIWATGWDSKSVLLGLRDNEKWSFFRLPKASHAYDGAHGWNTEWPRIRDIGTPKAPDYLMTMHGMFWRFPQTFATANTAGIRPRSSYLKVIGDFTRWNDKLVFGCDDSAQKEFLNKRKQKGDIPGPGQSNSNLWFTSIDKPDKLGPNTASGSVWLDEEIEKDEYSEPFLFAGWPSRMAWIRNKGKVDVDFVFEVDENGNGQWNVLKTVNVPSDGTLQVPFSDKDKGEWIRVKSNKKTLVTVSFNYSSKENRSSVSDTIFKGLSKVSDKNLMGGLLYSLGDNKRVLGISSNEFKGKENIDMGYYELDEALNLVAKEDRDMNSFIKDKFAISKNAVQVEESSILIIDDRDRRWRLPLNDAGFNQLTTEGYLRICREVATERDLFNCHGTFYELPAENADGFAKIRPITSHGFRIHDYASYRGMLVMTGINSDSEATEHIIKSKDNKAAVWIGAIDDLWKMGKPTGQGGPWKDEKVTAHNPSDPYLIGFYDERALEISHDAKETVQFKIEVEPIGHGPWMLYKEVVVNPGETFEYVFPKDFEARWIRFQTNKDCKATTLLKYQ